MVDKGNRRISSVAHSLTGRLCLLLWLITAICCNSACMSLKTASCKHHGFVPSASPTLPQCATRLHGAIAGIQPSGEVHVGNYIGCINPAVKYQNDKGDLIFMIADLHATTGEKSSVVLKDAVKSTVATLLACGIDPDKTSIFLQSDIQSILELNWILGTVLSLGRLRKLANFGRRDLAKDSESVGLCLYPLLMAADILGSNCSTVIAGPDQKCHISITREVAEKLNRQLQEDILCLPTLHKHEGFRVLSLDGKGKMSKSSEKASSRINLLDSDEIVADKLRSAKTSTSMEQDSPEVENLSRLYSYFSQDSSVDTPSKEGVIQFRELKSNLQREMSRHLGRIRCRYKELINDDQALRSALLAGKSRVTPIFTYIVERVKQRCNYYIPELI